jgi:UDP-N-acetyl-D-mannosaminuronate dehydrogenase
LTILGGQDNLPKIISLLGNEDIARVNSHLENCKRHPTLTYEFSDGLWLVPVKDVSYENGNQEVFSVEVENTETIVTNFGIIAHNCIGVDPYYLAEKAKDYGYHSEVILSGRRINDNMGIHIAHEIIRLLIEKGHPVKDSVVRVFGCSFKENCADARNSKVFDIVKELQKFHCVVQVVDPFVDKKFIKSHYGVELHPFEDSKDGGCNGEVSAAIIAVAHDKFKSLDFGESENRKMVVYDVKGILPRKMIDGRL